MIKKLLFLIVDITLFWSCLIPYVWAKTPAPCIEASPLSFDFGKIKEGPIYKTKFKVDNCGNAPLHIVHVRTSCGCTGAVIGKKVLNPSESTEVIVTFHSAGISGPFRKYISIQSNDPTCPNLLLEIKGISIPQPGPSLALEPWKIHILKKKNNFIYIRIRLANKGTKPLVITKIIALHYDIILLHKRLIILPHKRKVLVLRFKKPPFIIRKLVFLIYSNDPNQPIHYLLVLPKRVQFNNQKDILGCPTCNEEKILKF